MSILDDFVGGLVQKFFSRNDENSGTQDSTMGTQSAEPATPPLKERVVEAGREQWKASEAARTSGTRGGSTDGWPVQPPMVSGALFEQPVTSKQPEGEGLFGVPLFGSTQDSWFDRPSEARRVSIFGEARPDEKG